MANIMKVSNDMTVLGFKDFISIKHLPFVGKNFQETMELVIRYSLRNKVDLSKVLNQLSQNNFHTALITRVFGDVRRFVPKLDKVLMPTLLFAFIESSLTQAGINFTSAEINVVKMMHLSLFSQWGAVIESSLPAAVAYYDKLTPTVTDLQEDMIRVFMTKRAAEFVVPDLPRERISAPLVAQILLDVYTDVQRSVVTVNNISEHVKVVLDVLRDYLTDSMRFDKLHSDPQFQAFSTNFTLLSFAKMFTEKSELRKYDGWFVASSIREVTDYLRSEEADITVYRVRDLAAICTSYRMVNENTKQIKATLLTPNFRLVNWAHWFYRELAYGDRFSKLFTFRDPTGVISDSVKALSPEFLETQLVATIYDFSQYDMRNDSSFTSFNLLPAKDANDLKMAMALSKSNFIRFDLGPIEAPESNGNSVEFFYEIDDAIVTAFAADVVKMDSVRVAKTFSPDAVIAYSKVQLESSIAYPLKIQTLEFAAKDSMLDTTSLRIHGTPLNTEIVMRDTYYEGGKPIAKGGHVKTSDFIFNGDPLFLINISYSSYLTSAIDNLLVSLIDAMGIASSISHVKARLLNNVWMSIKKHSNSNEFEWAASNFRRLIDVPIDPRAPQDATRNYVKSVLAFFRFSYILGTSVNPENLAKFMNLVFDGQIDIIGMLTDADIKKIAT